MLNALFKFTKLPRSLGSDVSIGLLFNLKSVGPTLDLASRHFFVATKKQRFCRMSHKSSLPPRKGKLLRSALERDGMSNNTYNIFRVEMEALRSSKRRYAPRRLGGVITDDNTHAASWNLKIIVTCHNVRKKKRGGGSSANIHNQRRLRHQHPSTERGLRR